MAQYAFAAVFYFCAEVNIYTRPNGDTWTVNAIKSLPGATPSC